MCDEGVEDAQLARLASTIIGKAHRRLLMVLAEGPVDGATLALRAHCDVTEARGYFVALESLGLARIVTLSPAVEQYTLTDLVEVEHQERKVRIRVGNERGEFVEVRFIP